MYMNPPPAPGIAAIPATATYDPATRTVIPDDVGGSQSSAYRIKTRVVDGIEQRIQQRLGFDLTSTQTFHIDIPYRSIYGQHPRHVFFYGPIGASKIHVQNDDYNPYTGLTTNEHRQRLQSHKNIDNTQREQTLRHVMKEGAAWEMSSGESLSAFVFAVKGKFAKKRLGAKAVK